MGGDFAPLEIVLGAIQAVKEYKVPVVLVEMRMRSAPSWRSIMRIRTL